MTLITSVLVQNGVRVQYVAVVSTVLHTERSTVRVDIQYKAILCTTGTERSTVRCEVRYGVVVRTVLVQNGVRSGARPGTKPYRSPNGRHVLVRHTMRYKGSQRFPRQRQSILRATVIHLDGGVLPPFPRRPAAKMAWPISLCKLHYFLDCVSEHIPIRVSRRNCGQSLLHSSVRESFRSSTSLARRLKEGQRSLSFCRIHLENLLHFGSS